ncbi:MAG TPA: YbhB/YbcL family Raf kinase inhibitor-like protein [Steroidobacteraceae bacterium]|nr:YbhB/YbcL family Raf kinase inhibitor-like protein [Steroidobacteraceae bacterium]
MIFREPAFRCASILLTLGCMFALPATAQQKPATLIVTSPTLKQGERVPTQHTPDGRNDSPALNWSGAPVGTKSFVVFCEDPDVGNPPPFVHWAVYNIPGTAKGLPAALPIDASPMPTELNGTVQGLSGFRRAIYRGPAPPPGKPHSYHFVVYALDSIIATSAGQPPPTRAQLLDFMKGHVLATGELVATYDRK